MTKRMKEIIDKWEREDRRRKKEGGGWWNEKNEYEK